MVLSRVRLIRVRLVLVTNLNPINDTYKEKFLVGYCGIPQGHGFFPLWDFSKIENLSLKFREMLVGWIGRRL